MLSEVPLKLQILQLTRQRQSRKHFYASENPTKFAF